MVPYFALEKAKPSFDPAAFKAVCGDVRRLAITTTALHTAAQIGFWSGRDRCGRQVDEGDSFSEVDDKLSRSSALARRL